MPMPRGTGRLDMNPTSIDEIAVVTAKANAYAGFERPRPPLCMISGTTVNWLRVRVRVRVGVKV
eukprot:scaffold97437_cov67-Phaeocystis_antarctica.AAC.2